MASKHITESVEVGDKSVIVSAHADPTVRSRYTVKITVMLREGSKFSPLGEFEGTIRKDVNLRQSQEWVSNVGPYHRYAGTLGSALYDLGKVAGEKVDRLLDLQKRDESVVVEMGALKVTVNVADYVEAYGSDLSGNALRVEITETVLAAAEDRVRDYLTSVGWGSIERA